MIIHALIMAEINPLQSKCREVLQEREKTNRRYKRTAVEQWIGDQTADTLLESVKTLPYRELKIAMRCGLHGKAMTIAMQRLDEYKDHMERVVEEQMNTISPESDGKPSIDESKGFEQLDPELIKALIQNSNDEEITAIAGLFIKEMEDRKLIQAGD